MDANGEETVTGGMRIMIPSEITWMFQGDSPLARQVLEEDTSNRHLDVGSRPGTERSPRSELGG